MKEQRLAELIKTQRVKKKMTQKQLAELLHVSDKAISKWENGKCLPDRSMMNEISAVLDIPIEKLYQIKQTATWCQRFTREQLYIKKSEEIKLTTLCFLCSMMISIVLYYLQFFGEPTSTVLYSDMLGNFLSTFLIDGALLIFVLIIGMFFGYRHVIKYDQMKTISLNLGRILIGSIAVVLSVIEFYTIKVMRFPELSAFVAIFLFTVLLYQGALELFHTKERE